MIPLPKELHHALDASRGEPVRLADPETDVEYVVLRADVYERIRNLVYDDSPLTSGERRDLLVKAGLRAGWDDPEMDVYNDLDPRRSA